MNENDVIKVLKLHNENRPGFVKCPYHTGDREHFVSSNELAEEPNTDSEIWCAAARAERDRVVQALKVRTVTLEDIRRKRKPLLDASDKPMTPFEDRPDMPAGKKAEWVSYRAALRDITAPYKKGNETDPEASPEMPLPRYVKDVNWPTPPEE